MSYVSRLEAMGGASISVKRRAATLLTVLAMHIGLIGLLILSRSGEPPQKHGGSFSVFALAAAAPLAPPVPIAVPVIPAEAKPVNPSPTEVFAEQQGAEGDPDGVMCSPVDIVTTQLANDPIVPVAIGRVPRDDRSISEAIVMWNVEWTSSTSSEDAPLASVRNLIHLALTDLPPDCLAMPVIGPRLIPITDKDGSTTFLAFGSGEWSWQQLVDPPDPLTGNDKEWTWEELLDEGISLTF